ncbi:hypothetical protein G7K_0498-t1 [Saitoella complicata NRRL Y-17804]|uniref:Uncharacterized protein n=1 Tax=Saitoella complicata (strain BCRC 22490 / CBS 7301 / JCM 7358 / NBRC 10748 / NRRL Y-17804) TaxID=698492 RepID=A0A0E9N8X0_SAICN|nr:hypothetical protein G7K_0498-t1 [Saitoella complicata NRRL Y-17804]
MQGHAKQTRPGNRPSQTTNQPKKTNTKKRRHASVIRKPMIKARIRPITSFSCHCQHWSLISIPKLALS